MTPETKFKKELTKEIEARFPSSMVLRTNPNHIQGIPDIIVLKDDKWAALEVKKSASAEHQPNQDYYVDQMDEMSYAAFVYPENKEEVLDALQQTFEPGR